MIFSSEKKRFPSWLTSPIWSWHFSYSPSRFLFVSHFILCIVQAVINLIYTYYWSVSLHCKNCLSCYPTDKLSYLHISLIHYILVYLQSRVGSQCYWCNAKLPRRKSIILMMVFVRRRHTWTLGHYYTAVSRKSSHTILK